MKKIILLLSILTLMFSCGGNPKTASKEKKSLPKVEQEVRKRHFKPSIPPQSLPEDVQIGWLKENYWQNFDFRDTLFLKEVDTAEMVEAYATFIQVMMFTAEDSSPMDSLMRKASVNRPMLDYFAWLGELMLHNPNSPMRNDEFYIPVLKAILRAPYYDKYERLAPEYDLRIALKNRVGHRANDIVYTLSSGAEHRLYEIATEYTLLFLSNPGCPMCLEVTHALSSSPMINEMLEQKRLTILMIYPDANLEEWSKHQKEIPSSWINAYDKGTKISRTESYDLKAIPALYLLDRQKNVLVKDATDVALIEEVIDRRS